MLKLRNDSQRTGRGGKEYHQQYRRQEAEDGRQDSQSAQPIDECAQARERDKDVDGVVHVGAMYQELQSAQIASRSQ